MPSRDRRSSPRPAAVRPTPAPSLTRLAPCESKLLVRLVDAGAAGLARAGREGEDGLERRGLAAFEGSRVVATEAGRARVAREAAGAEGLLAQHRTVARKTVATEAGHETLLVDLDESPLAWLARRKGRDGKPLLGLAEVAAGERLRSDFTRARMTPRVTANWEAAVSSGRRGGGGQGLDLADAVVAAQKRVSLALEAVGPELSGALVDVCCFLKGLEEVERERSWPARGAKLVLGLGLARLARHYGLVAEGVGPGRILRWGSADSRPTIDGE